ncbi:DUF523 domain-containing protein [Schaalia sp. ZJ1691]|uniref:DUF523 domain-containing protein n=1 Tax=Schaalia sp. ZJ1691 TaxID=2709404 RepID=UPI0013ECBCCC|nr:DUF523 domain-containing protein [Schaalia sp. ZJ1691]
MPSPSAPDQSDAPILVSACLAGIPCRYDGAAKPDPAIIAAVDQGRAIARCAERSGGLPTPRPPAEIVGGSADDVVRGRARVLTADGTDVSLEFVAGALAVADEAVSAGVTTAILQARSPSCGCGTVYDGTHSGVQVSGDGVLTAILKSRGIDVIAHD